MITYPSKLKKGDEVRVVAPSRSLSIISEERVRIATERLSEMGLKISFGNHTKESDELKSSSIKSRIDDLHDAFLNKNIRAVITVVGGYNSNQLLRYIDWKIIKNNPKIFCGYSDITALCNSIFAKTGLVTYYGPHYSCFSEKYYFDYTLDYFKKCLFNNDLLEILPSKIWSDDNWRQEQEKRDIIANKGFLAINEGSASGRVLGGNLCTFNLIQGTEYFPKLENCILFIEDDDEVCPETFDRDLQSLIHLPDFSEVKGVVIGRFQKESQMTEDLLFKIIKNKKELNAIPVIANVDFGHTDPKVTFPIGGMVKIKSEQKQPSIVFSKH